MGIHAGPARSLTLALVAPLLVAVIAYPAWAEEAPPPETAPGPAPAAPGPAPAAPEPAPAATTAPPVDAPPDTEPAPEPPETVEAPAPAPPAPTGPVPTFTPVKRYDVVKKLVFPVVGVAKFYGGFGACRDNCTREHHGIDITTYGWKGLPVVAAHDGTVVKVTYNEGNPGCSVRIRGRDRWETRYYHLNNDIPGTDEIGAPCPAPGIEVGVEVQAGQIIGYLGDSGNSEHTVPHLHFELRNRSGYPIDPYRSLRRAARISYEWLPNDAQTATLTMSQATHRDAEAVTLALLVPADEMHRIGASETDETILSSPLIAVNRDDPTSAIAEVTRVAPERIVVMSDAESDWLEQLVRPMAPIVERTGLPRPDRTPEPLIPDDVEPEVTEFNPMDRFSTIVAGVVDRIHRSRVPAYEEFIEEHKAVVLTTERWAPSRIGVRSWSSAGKRADRQLLWWRTGEGWIGTETAEDAPHPGVAYVTEKMAQPQTFTYLGSLAELPPYPQWRSS